jgi:hypothetical protein
MTWLLNRRRRRPTPPPRRQARWIAAARPPPSGSATRGRPVLERQQTDVLRTGNLCFSWRFATIVVSGAAPSQRGLRRLVAVMRGGANFGGRPLPAARTGHRPTIGFFESMVPLTCASAAGSRSRSGPSCGHCSRVRHLPSIPAAKTGKRASGTGEGTRKLTANLFAALSVLLAAQVASAQSILDE